MIACDLQGAAVLVTRPRQQAAGLAAAVRELGGQPVLFPALEVEAAGGGLPPGGLEGVELVVFVSRNAVRFGLPNLQAAGGIPAAARVAAIGAATAAELQTMGVADVIVPRAGADSEALSAEPALADVRGRRVLIVRGAHGREHLADVLTARGAQVRYHDCYRRRRPAAPAGGLVALWQRSQIRGWTATSAEIVDNLFAVGGAAAEQALRHTPLFVPHARIAARAFSRGVETIVVTAPGDRAIAAGLATWFCRLRILQTSKQD